MLFNGETKQNEGGIIIMDIIMAILLSIGMFSCYLNIIDSIKEYYENKNKKK